MRKRMIVYSRKKDESIIIGNDISITIIDIRGDKVRLGIEVPRDVSVFRKEHFDMIMQEKQQENKPKD